MKIDEAVKLMEKGHTCSADCSSNYSFKIEDELIVFRYNINDIWRTVNMCPELLTAEWKLVEEEKFNLRDSGCDCFVMKVTEDTTTSFPLRASFEFIDIECKDYLLNKLNKHEQIVLFFEEDIKEFIKQFHLVAEDMMDNLADKYGKIDYLDVLNIKQKLDELAGPRFKVTNKVTK